MYLRTLKSRKFALNYVRSLEAVSLSKAVVELVVLEEVTGTVLELGELVGEQRVGNCMERKQIK